MAEEKKGIKELKEMVIFVAALGNAVDVSTKDGLSVEDIGSYLPAFMLAPEAFTGIGEISKEAADLDPAELDEISKALSEKLSLENKELEAVIEKALVVIANIFKMAEDIKALRA